MGLCLHSRWTALLRQEMDRRLFLPYWIMAEFGGGDTTSLFEQIMLNNCQKTEKMVVITLVSSTSNMHYFLR